MLDGRIAREEAVPSFVREAALEVRFTDCFDIFVREAAFEVRHTDCFDILLHSHTAFVFLEYAYLFNCIARVQLNNLYVLVWQEMYGAYCRTSTYAIRLVSYGTYALSCVFVSP